MLSNVLIMDFDRVRADRLANQIGRNTILMLDFIGLNLGNGSVYIFKNRYTHHQGVVAFEVMELILSYEQMSRDLDERLVTMGLRSKA